MFGLELPKLIIYALIAITVMGMIGTGVYKVKQWGANEVRAEWEQDVRDQREKELNQAMSAATGLEADKAKAKIIYVEVEKKLAEYLSRPVYNNICIDSDGVRELNRALEGS